MSIIRSAPVEVVSYNDLTSRPATAKPGHNVQIDAQVVQAEHLGWYYSLLALCPDIPGELKSSVVTARFEDLPVEKRSSIWMTLSKVRIHISDPRPYAAHMDDITRSALGRDDAPNYVRRLASEGNPGARYLDELTKREVAKLMLRDSAPVRANWYAEYTEEVSMLVEPEAFAPPDIVSVEDFGYKPKALVRKVSEFNAKAAAAFHGCLDSLDLITPDFARFSSYGRSVRNGMIKPLLAPHGFDVGDTKQITLLQHVRETFFTKLTAHDPWGGRLWKLESPHCEIDSKDSFFVQAADLATGIAASLFQRQGIVGVVGKFEYVTYNGLRLNMADAEEVMHKERFFKR